MRSPSSATGSRRPGPERTERSLPPAPRALGRRAAARERCEFHSLSRRACSQAATFGWPSAESPTRQEAPGGLAGGPLPHPPLEQVPRPGLGDHGGHQQAGSFRFFEGGLQPGVVAVQEGCVRFPRSNLLPDQAHEAVDAGAVGCVPLAAGDDYEVGLARCGTPARFSAVRAESAKARTGSGSHRSGSSQKMRAFPGAPAGAGDALGERLPAEEVEPGAERQQEELLVSLFDTVFEHLVEGAVPGAGAGWPRLGHRRAEQGGVETERRRGAGRHRSGETAVARGSRVPGDDEGRTRRVRSRGRGGESWGRFAHPVAPAASLPPMRPLSTIAASTSIMARTPSSAVMSETS